MDDNNTIKRLIKELQKQRSGGYERNLYYYTQVFFAFNSNKMEGISLTEDQTQMIFESNSFIANKDENVKVDDVIEVSNHFRVFDYILDTYERKLDLDYIISLNKMLKRGTSYERNPDYNVGGFKTKTNIIGILNVIKTSKPSDVKNDMIDLLDDYYQKETITLDDIIDFHVRFERIHPFGDGNGRVGRLIMYKECLNNNVFPFIILDRDKNFYIRGLREYDRQPIYLKDTILSQQDKYIDICMQLLDLNVFEFDKYIECNRHDAVIFYNEHNDRVNICMIGKNENTLWYWKGNSNIYGIDINNLESEIFDNGIITELEYHDNFETLNELFDNLFENDITSLKLMGEVCCQYFNLNLNDMIKEMEHEL